MDNFDDLFNKFPKTNEIKTTSGNEKEWKETLGKYGYEMKRKEEVEEDEHSLRSARRQKNFWLIMLLIVVIGAAFLIMANDGKFKSDISTNLTCGANTCPTCPTCPTIPTCPTTNCNNTCNFPSTLNVILKNSS